MIQARLTVVNGGEPELLPAMRVSADTFQTLGIRPALGRTFVEGEDQEGSDRVAILSDSFWRRSFNADPSIIGRTIQVDSRGVTVAGVLPRGLQFPNLHVLETGRSYGTEPELFVPLVFSKEELSRLMGQHNYNVIARLKRGVTPGQARAELDSIAAQLVELSRQKVELRATVSPLLEAMAGQSRRGLIVLLVAVGAVLLIVCVNLANLMVARGVRQSREMAIRTALGASGARLLRQSLTQSLLIGFLGGALGVAMAGAGLGVLLRNVPAEIPRLNEVRLDGRVLGFAFAVTVLTGFLFGLAPAWRAARTNPQSALKAGGRALVGAAGGLRLRSVLVIAEVGLSALLLMTAALLMTSFLRLMNAEKGFHAPNVLTADLRIPSTRYSTQEQRSQFHERVLERLATEPGILSAAVTTALPLQGEVWIDMVWLPGDTRPIWEQPTTNVRFVSPGYLDTMGIPLRAGRTFNTNDRNKVIVSERLGQILWPGQDPIGRQLRNGGATREVIGVAGDVRTDAHLPPPATVYRPYWEWGPAGVKLVARSAGDPRSAALAMRAAVRAVDPGIALAQMGTMQDILEQSVAQRQFQMLLVVAFACVALLLASLGIYGVVSYSVMRRTNEMGIRMALGAQRRQVCGIVLKQGMKPVVLGLSLGLAGSLAADRVLANLLYEVTPRDPMLLAVAALLLGAIGLAACLFPAQRATRVAPVTALRLD